MDTNFNITLFKMVYFFIHLEISKSRLNFYINWKFNNPKNQSLCN